ncbi:hypothetical protein [Bacillus gaemokensis]|uniref:Uncharacterized protein n=1 Tax=Bacillus gaemokensis TaxID=574375 RepID=A0A073KS59_9BACI|nr:hypothetical protein [Bacillus gaemokensis]KEK25228.1 hypothetical protein BAGA_11380 [Bacillus gaemokensis]KYG37330.1 hypothetical protein AZF08_07955 [Bacillus gaemokensis]
MNITAMSGTKIPTNFHLLGSFFIMAIMLSMRPRMMQAMLVKRKMLSKAVVMKKLGRKKISPANVIDRESKLYLLAK